MGTLYLQSTISNLKNKKIPRLVVVISLALTIFTVLCYFSLPFVVHIMYKNLHSYQIQKVLISIYKTAPYSSKTHFAKQYNQYKDDYSTLRLMMKGYNNNEKIYEPLLGYTLENPDLRPFAVKILLNNQEPISTDMLERFILIVREDKDYRFPIIIVLLEHLCFRNKEQSKIAVRAVNEIWGKPLLDFSEEPDQHGSFILNNMGEKKGEYYYE